MTDLDLDVDALLAEHGVPGCSVAVLEDDEIVLERGFGVSRRTTGEPVGRTTRMQACSMSKPVAVLAALRLVEQGLLDLDGDVADHLTRWTLPANGEWRPRLTLRQLASHTAGLTAHDGFPGYRRGAAVPSLVEVLSGTHPANAPGARVDLLPGIQFRYSGQGTTIIQLLMEEVTGRSAGELVADLVLEPLGMRDSSFAQDLDDEQRAHGHLSGGGAVPGGWHVQPEQCAAGLWTTAADYVRLLRGVQRAYAGAPDALLAASTARELLTPVAGLPAGRDMTGMDHIALGFFVATREGDPTWFGHTGSNTGFVCASMARVTGGRGAVVLINSEDGTPVARAVLRSIADSGGWDDIDLGDGGPSPRGPLLLDSHAGSYATGDGLRVELADRDGGVELSVPGQPPLRLSVEGPDALSTEAIDLRVLLEDAAIVLEQGGQVTRLVREA